MNRYLQLIMGALEQTTGVNRAGMCGEYFMSRRLSPLTMLQAARERKAVWIRDEDEDEDEDEDAAA